MSQVRKDKKKVPGGRNSKNWPGTGALGMRTEDGRGGEADAEKEGHAGILRNLNI